jgi:hypothetical protein
MAKLMGRIMTALAVVAIAFASGGCKTTNVTERSDRPTVTERTTVDNANGERVRTETKTTRE